ncbi:hypothetical protein D1007_11653 [Hordeum vulgare]|nr:hypothetical protein D1007_11653 [Hordeum vulgare]
MTKTGLTVLYTNDRVMLEDSINTMKRLLPKEDKYKKVSFDLAYTGGRAGHDQHVAFAQLCMRYHVLLYHYFVAIVPCERFTRFVNSPDYRFAMVDTTNDRKVLKTSGLAHEKLFDIHDHYKIRGRKKYMDSHIDVAEAIIDPYYGGLKAECKKNKPAWHRTWVKILDEHHIETATKEVYTCYEMFTRIIDMRNFVLPEYVEESNHKHSG